MSVSDLLMRLSDQGVRVSLDGSNLRVRGPANVMTRELTDELRRLKPELVEQLTVTTHGKSHHKHSVPGASPVDECRSKAVALQTWLSVHVDEHMSAEPFGMPEWVSALVEFDFVERRQLRDVFQYVGCFHEIGRCPEDAPVNCTACEDR